MNNITDFEMVNGVLKKYKGTDPNVIIPNGVTEIGEIAFYNCKSLVSVTIPKGVTKIGYGAFCKCESLENIIIPNSVIIIEENAFCGCKSLASATIPNSVTKIGVYAFKDCTSLTINCEAEKKPDGWSKYWNPDNHPVNWGHNPTKIASDFEIVNGVLIEYKGADPNVIIPEGVTSIGEHAFFNCPSLTSVTIPTGVTTIEKGAFWDCSSLTSAIIPNGVIKIGILAFLDCTSLASITIPNSVTEIGDWAFWGCESLKSIIIPNGVTKIGENAFCRCTSLEKLTVEPSNPSYKSIDGNLYSKDGKALIQYAVGKKEKVFAIPNSVTSIGSRAFEKCPSLVGITIPDSVSAIGESAFAFCYSLADIKIPSSVIAIGAYAFACCMSLEITCDANKALDSWSEKWNSNNRPVNWRCTQKNIYPILR